jgi:cytochrome b561
MFGWFELPPIWPEDRSFSGQLFSIHRLIGVTIAALVAAHAAHSFITLSAGTAFFCA